MTTPAPAAMNIALRTYSFLDSLQPQLASFIATTARGFLPVPHVASLFIEIAPGIAINRLTDVALKATQVAPAIQVVERAYGLLEVHHEDKGQVQNAGAAILRELGATLEDRLAPRVLSSQIIRGVEPYQTQIINRFRFGSMILPGQSLYILEVEPAGYSAFAANEAEKAARIILVDASFFGAFGRLYLAGEEAEIDAAFEAVEAGLKSITGKTPPPARDR